MRKNKKEKPAPMDEEKKEPMEQEGGQPAEETPEAPETPETFTVTREQMEKQMEEQAKKRIEVRLTLEAVVKAEDIQVSDEELAKEIAEMAETYKMEADKFKELMGEEEIDRMKTDIAVQKAVDLIAAEAKEV